MKTAVRSLTPVLAAGLMLLVCNKSLAAPPSGIFSTHIANPTNAVWDMTAVTDLHNISLDFQDQDQFQIQFDVDFVQTGTGKLQGAGNTVVSLVQNDIPQPDFTAAYAVKGTLKSTKGVARLNLVISAKGVAQIEGATRNVVTSEKANLVIDSVQAEIVSGNFAQKASASGLGSISDSGPVDPQPLPAELGDGSWTLSMEITPDAKNKYSGTASVTLSTGKVYSYDVIGKYSSKQDRTLLVLKGTGDAKGSSLKITMSGDDITAIQGKISGQAVVAQ